jgi:hypothetical protein
MFKLQYLKQPTGPIQAARMRLHAVKVLPSGAGSKARGPMGLKVKEKASLCRDRTGICCFLHIPEKYPDWAIENI